jgi:hypothetical protein
LDVGRSRTPDDELLISGTTLHRQRWSLSLPAQKW